MKKINSYLIVLMVIFFIGLQGCTDLEPEVLDGVLIEGEDGGSSVSTESLLLEAYTQLNLYQDQARTHIVSEHTTDAMVGPTRGRDWDDNGVWRQLHVHTWNPLHGFLRDSWNAMLTGVFTANQVLENNPNDQQAAEAKMIRAYHYFFVIDMFGILPFREIGSDLTQDPSFLNRTEGTQFLIDELESIISDLPDLSDPSIANKDAARFLLAKLYLNKAVYTSENPAGPYNFEVADMNKVIENIDAMTATLATEYWDNFIPLNSQTSPEIIFASENLRGNSANRNGNVQSRWRMGNHYNQTPDGWNGFTTLAEYYEMFDPNDIRINNPDPDALANSGYNLGYQVGQQYGPGGPGVGEPLQDRNSQPLFFTKEVSLLTSGESLETAGIRGVKYKPDYADVNNPENDYVLARFSDALLMKAEAIARGGSSGDTPASIVNAVRQRAGQPDLGAVSLQEIYDERGRELWWEGWRRNDMIRFETYLDTKELKPFESGNERVLFTIPAGALSSFPQNPGY